MLALSQAFCPSRIRVGWWIYEHSPVEASTALLDMPCKWDSSEELLIANSMESDKKAPPEQEGLVSIGE